MRVRLDPMPLWPEIALKFALTRDRPQMAAQVLVVVLCGCYCSRCMWCKALETDPVRGHPEDQVKEVEAMLIDLIQVSEYYILHTRYRSFNIVLDTKYQMLHHDSIQLL